jgi:hypothetical protein
MLDDKDDIRDIPWIASWTPMDQQARKGQSCMPLREESGPDGTTIVTAQASCEAGMAHTRPGDRIVIPESVPGPVRSETIQHELIHIYQRRFADEWKKFYRQSWSFEFQAAPHADIPDSLIAAKRSNPDTWDPAMGGPWVRWMSRYWPIPIYTNTALPQLRDARTVWWDEWRKEILTEAPDTWRAFFGSPAQEEHPHEIAAVLLTAGDTTNEAGRRLANWWSTTGVVLRSSRNTPTDSPYNL